MPKKKKKGKCSEQCKWNVYHFIHEMSMKPKSVVYLVPMGFWLGEPQTKSKSGIQLTLFKIACPLMKASATQSSVFHCQGCDRGWKGAKPQVLCPYYFQSVLKKINWGMGWGLVNHCLWQRDFRLLLSEHGRINLFENSTVGKLTIEPAQVSPSEAKKDQ